MSKYDISRVEWPDGLLAPGVQEMTTTRGLVDVVPATAYADLLEVATELARCLMSEDTMLKPGESLRAVLAEEKEQRDAVLAKFNEGEPANEPTAANAAPSQEEA